MKYKLNVMIDGEEQDARFEELAQAVTAWARWLVKGNDCRLEMLCGTHGWVTFDPECGCPGCENMAANATQDMRGTFMSPGF